MYSSKHLELTDGTITGFRTHLTGELAALLSAESVLRHSVVPMPELAFDDLDPGGFDEGWERAALGPVTADLFSIRARQVLGGRSRKAGSSFLLGLLIGHECAGLIGAGDEPGVVLLGGGPLRAWYQRGLEKSLGGRLLVAAEEEIAMAIARAHVFLFRRR
ncbi:MAG: 2-dehydro-3-deoxygalactonokinase [Verrucomicrobiota bacterium]